MTLDEIRAFIDIAQRGHGKKASEFKLKHGQYAIKTLMLSELIEEHTNPQYLVTTSKGKRVIEALQAVCSI